MNQQTNTDDLLLVSRGHLAVLLPWAAHQSGEPVRLNAQTQLEHELIATEPPDDWFDNAPDDDADVHEHDEPQPVRRAVAVATLVCSLLVLAGAGIAWLLVVTGP